MNKFFLTGIILAGGKSKRLPGKIFLKLGNLTLIENLIQNVRKFFKELLVITSYKRKIFKDLDILIFPDIIKNIGPIGGIYTGIFFSNTYYNFFIAADMPFVRGDLIKYLESKIEDFDIVIPETSDGLHPLFGIYSKACLPFIEEQIKKGDLKVTNFYKYLKVKYVKMDKLKRFNPEVSLFNLNTIQDYKRAKIIYNRGLNILDT